MTTIYRIIGGIDWDAAVAAGTFHGTAHDRRDGFIHFSAAHQVVETAAKHYAGQSGLMLVSVSAETLAECLPGALRWEVSRGGEPFPHLYASLPLALVRRVEPLPLAADGKHAFPALDAGR